MPNLPRSGHRVTVPLSDDAYQHLQRLVAQAGYVGHSPRTGIAGYLIALFKPPTTPLTPPYPFVDNRPDALRAFDGPRLKNGKLPFWLPDRYTSLPSQMRRNRLLGHIPPTTYDALYRVAIHYGISSPNRTNTTHVHSIAHALIEALGLDYLHPLIDPPPVQVIRRNFKPPWELVF